MNAIGPEVDVMLGGEIALAPARNNARAPLRSTAVSGSVKVPGWESWKTLASVTAYHSFGGEVELRTPHDTPPYLLMPSPTSAHSSSSAFANRFNLSNASRSFSSAIRVIQEYARVRARKSSLTGDG